MKIALIKNVKYGTEFVTNNNVDDNPEYVRLSEYIDVEFPPRPVIETIAEQIKELDLEADKLNIDLESIKQKKAELLSLTVQS